MTKEDFRNLVFSIARAHGQPYLANTDVASLDALILEQLRKFSAETKCLYHDKVTFTVNTTPAGRFDLRDTDYFTYPMLEVRRVVINSNTLPGPFERSGPLGLEGIELDYQNYRTGSTGTPKVWGMVPPHTLLLVPAPSATISNCYVSGWYLHPEMTTDQTELSFNIEDQRGAAYVCAAELLVPYASAEGIAKIRGLRELAAEAKAETTARASRMFNTGVNSIRRPYRDTRIRL